MHPLCECFWCCYVRVFGQSFFLCSLFVRFEKIEETLRARPRSGSLPVARTEKMRKVCFSWFWLLLFRGPALCAQFGRRMISFFVCSCEAVYIFVVYFFDSFLVCVRVVSRVFLRKRNNNNIVAQS